MPASCPHCCELSPAIRAATSPASELGLTPPPTPALPPGLPRVLAVPHLLATVLHMGGPRTQTIVTNE